MERKLSQLFDRQKFQQNARLNSIISDVESRHAGVLSDDDLNLINAAGVPAESREPFTDETAQNETTPMIPILIPKEKRP